MTRREFLTSSSEAIVTAAFVSQLPGCVSTAPTLHIPAINAKVTIPRSELLILAEPESYLKLYVDDYANPIIVFRRGGKGVAAVLSTCAHSGCEVKKVRAKFECPCHGSEYDLYGNVVKGPAVEGLDSFHASEFADRIEINLERL